MASPRRSDKQSKSKTVTKSSCGIIAKVPGESKVLRLRRLKLVAEAKVKKKKDGDDDESTTPVDGEADRRLYDEYHDGYVKRQRLHEEEEEVNSVEGAAC